jgi:hypothetical protein
MATDSTLEALCHAVRAGNEHEFNRLLPQVKKVNEGLLYFGLTPSDSQEMETALTVAVRLHARWAIPPLMKRSASHIVDLLLDHGGDADVKDDAGKTVLDYCDSNAVVIRQNPDLLKASNVIQLHPKKKTPK